MKASSSKRRLYSVSHRRLAIFAGLAIIVVISFFVLSLWKKPPSPPSRSTESPTNPSDERYYFADSKYQGIRSKFVTRNSTKQKVSIEYPITGIKSIDMLASKTIDQADEDFTQAVKAGSSISEPMTETIGYQVSYNSAQHLSLIISIKQNTHGAHPASLRYFWTFDKKSGKPITLRELVGGSDASVAKVLALAQKSAKKALAEVEKPDAAVDDSIDETVLQNFVVNSSTTIGWPFGQGMVLASSQGEIELSVSVNELVAELQNPLAKSLFTVPDPPKPKPVPVPSTPITPAPRTGASCPGGRCVAITFDDGPGAHTMRLLDILDQRGAKATFFVIGSKVDAQAGVLRRMQTSGHQIGNHTWSHPSLTRLSLAGIRQEIGDTNAAIQRAIGYTPKIVRPPYGATSQTVNTELGRLGMSSVLWSVDTRDWADRNSSIVCSRAVANARPGAIILLHDIHVTSVNAIPCILDALSRQGYGFVTIDMLLGNTVPGQVYYGR